MPKTTGLGQPHTVRAFQAFPTVGRLSEPSVAANHVDALVTPLGQHRVSDMVHSRKSFTALKTNEAWGKSGVFWQKERFDHIVRSPASTQNFRAYMLSHELVEAGDEAGRSVRPPVFDRI